MGCTAAAFARTQAAYETALKPSCLAFFRASWRRTLSVRSWPWICGSNSAWPNVCVPSPDPEIGRWSTPPCFGLQAASRSGPSSRPCGTWRRASMVCPGGGGHLLPRGLRGRGLLSVPPWFPLAALGNRARRAHMVPTLGCLDLQGSAGLTEPFQAEQARRAEGPATARLIRCFEGVYRGSTPITDTRPARGAGLSLACWLSRGQASLLWLGARRHRCSGPGCS